MKTPTPHWLVLPALMLILAGCGTAGPAGNTANGAGDNSGGLNGGPATTQISMIAQEGPAVPAMIKALESSDVTGTPVNLTGVWVNVKEFEIKIDGSCADVSVPLNDPVTCELDDDHGEHEDSPEAEIKVKGPVVADLIQGTLTPTLDPFVLPAGTLREVEVELDDLDETATLPAGVPESLRGNTLVAEGSALLDSGDTPFSIRLDFSEELEFDNLDGIVLSETVDFNQILLTLDVAQWFAGVDLQGCVDSGDIELVEGVLIIDDEHTHGECSDIEDRIKDNIEKSSSLEDDDHDGEDDDGDEMDDHGDDGEDDGTDDSSDDSGGDDS